MSYAVDTNILARSVQENHAMHAVAKESVKQLLDRGEEVYVLAKRFQDIITVIEPADIVEPPSVGP
jgi:hypothetical protein